MPQTFMQLVELHTDSPTEVKEVYLSWAEALEYSREGEVVTVVTQDMESEGWVMVVIFYNTVEDAVRIAGLEVTKYVYSKLEKLCEDGPFFRNLKVVE